MENKKHRWFCDWCGPKHLVTLIDGISVCKNCRTLYIDSGTFPISRQKMGYLLRNPKEAIKYKDCKTER